MEVMRLVTHAPGDCCHGVPSRNTDTRNAITRDRYLELPNEEGIVQPLIAERLRVIRAGLCGQKNRIFPTIQRFLTA